MLMVGRLTIKKGKFVSLKQQFCSYPVMIDKQVQSNNNDS